MTRALLAVLCALLFVPAAVAQTGPAECGELRSAFGPFDYRTAPQATRSVVEDHHFTRDVETLRRGVSGPVGGELSYTLTVFPNHPRALLAMMKLGEKQKTEKPTGSRHTVACWFDRAVRFRPDDATVRTLYGVYLLKRGLRSDAIKQLEEATVLAGDDANVHYNLGLAYFDLKDYDKSLEHAHKAYALGFPLPGLKHKLQQAKKWRAAAPTPRTPAANGTTGSN